MAIIFADRVFSMTLIDKSNYYTDPSIGLLLGSAEKYCAQAMTTDVQPGTPVLSVYLQTSNDGISWVSPPAGGKVIDSVPVTANMVAFGYSIPNASTTTGRFARLQVFLTGTTPACRVDIWLVGRDAY